MKINIVRAALVVLWFALATPALAQTTVTLMQGQNGYSGTTDAKIACCTYADTNYGADTYYALVGETSTSLLVRFAIFAAEGGPVPNGATITSATLSFYKYWGPDAVYKASRLLKSWNESQVTWTITGAGSSWSTPGAFGATDVAATPDGQGSVGDAAGCSVSSNWPDYCWLNINVTSGVQAFASGASNYGWKIAYVSGSNEFSPKEFNSRENPNWLTLRPKLTVTYTTTPPPSGGTATLMEGQNSYSGTTDAKIACCTYADTNYGADTYYALIADTSTSLLIRFAIFQSEGGPVPNGATISSATLSFYKYWGPDAVFKASRLLKSWNESQVTWTATGTGASWSTPGAFGATDVAATADGQGSVGDAAGCAVSSNWPDYCWLNINVTAGVQAFASGTPNYGWKIAYVSGANASSPKEFNSRENPNWPTLRPKLTITYQTTQGPTARLTATPTSGMAPLGVTFSAADSTPGSFPITSLRLQFGDGTPDVTWSDKNQTQPHTYGTAATYTATLTVTDSNGNTSSASTTITVTPGPTPPTAQLTAAPSTGPPPLVVSFNASSSTQGSAPITSLRLRFGDGSADVTWTDKNQPQSHTYGVMGTYIATLTVTDANNLSSTASRTIQVTGGPVACIQSPLPASGVAIATFHSMGLYYNPPTAPTGDQIFMRYRQGSDDPNAAGAWKQGHPLWYDSRANHAYRGRGSVVHLQPATQYVFEVGIGASYASANWQHHIPGPNGDAVEPCPATWSETFPVGTTLTPWTGTKTTTTSSFYKGARSDSARNHVLLADQSGTPNGYTVYDFTGAAAVAQAPNASGYYPVVISGSYIILKGLKTVGGESGIFIDPGSHDIVIDGCEITSYSRDSGTPLGSGLTGNRGVNEDAGIKFPDSSYGPILDTKRIVIQRSKIHNPAFGNNPWDGGHPFGPAPITMYPTGGQVVIRYNETYSTTNGQLNGPPDLNHFHLDGLVLGGENGQTIGPDVDIYKNLVMHYFDDGVETDGDGINVRVWKNYFDYGGATGISTTPTAVGPAYVWRNVYNRSRTLITQPWGNESDRNAMMKSGGLGGLNGGRRYLYHNTSLQPPYTSESDGVGPYSLGAGNGAGGAGGTGNGMENTVARNNVFEIWKPWWGAYDLTNASGNDLDYDLTNGNLSEAHGLQSTPQYQTNNGWSAYWAGRYRLQAGTPGHDDGIPIPNFNDDYVGAAPDRGAHEDGTPDMIFGTTATGS